MMSYGAHERSLTDLSLNPKRMGQRFGARSMRSKARKTGSPGKRIRRELKATNRVEHAVDAGWAFGGFCSGVKDALPRNSLRRMALRIFS